MCSRAPPSSGPVCAGWGCAGIVWPRDVLSVAHARRALHLRMSVRVVRSTRHAPQCITREGASCGGTVRSALPCHSVMRRIRTLSPAAPTMTNLCAHLCAGHGERRFATDSGGALCFERIHAPRMNICHIKESVRSAQKLVPIGPGFKFKTKGVCLCQAPGSAHMHTRIVFFMLFKAGSPY